MTEFLKDFNWVKSSILNSKTINDVIQSKIYMDMFIDKYVAQVSHTNQIFITHKQELTQLYEKKFRSFSSCL